MAETIWRYVNRDRDLFRAFVKDAVFVYNRQD